MIAATATPPLSSAAEIRASAPHDVSVSIYRAPSHGATNLDADRLEGFALVSETRSISLPAGESRIRFEGVADGIESESAIVTGLPSVIIEKNRDARVLTPAALIEAALGRNVELVRTDRKSHRTTHVAATILTNADHGVLFQTAEGIEALRCSGLRETFLFSPTSDLRASPTLSVLVRSPRDVTANVTLSYLAHGFDWLANYVVTVAPDGRTMDMAAWVTLANGNGVSFPSARTQIIAGRVNRETRAVQPYALASGILAYCWPRGSTSDPAETPVELRAKRGGFMANTPIAVAEVAVRALSAAAPAQLVHEEQLGDLKLYRVPERTDVRSRQIKQVRLLERKAIPVHVFYARDVIANQSFDSSPAWRRIRTRNDIAHHLGLPLPSGRVASFTSRADSAVLLAEAPLRDVAVDEEFEFDLGDAADVQVRATAKRVEIRNATRADIDFELALRLPDGTQLATADHSASSRNGRPLFELKLPAGGTVVLHYATKTTLPRRMAIARNTTAVMRQMITEISDASAPKMPPESQSGPESMPLRRPLVGVPDTAIPNIPP